MPLRFAVTVFVALCVVTSSTAQSTQTGQLRLVSTAWSPFTNDSGQPRFALDLVETALGRIGLSARTAIVEPARFTSALLSGEFDGSAAAWKDAERERVLIFSQPYLENRLILVGRRGADVSAASLGELNGKRVAIVEGYSYGDALNLSGATLVRSQSEEDSLALLLASKTDYTLMDELVVHYLMNNYPTQVSTRLNVGSRALVTRPLYFAVKRARPDAETIVNRFNAQLHTMIVDRTYHRLLHVSWISADVDGDGVSEFVPASDRSGTAEPQRAYALSTTTGQRTPESSEGKSKSGFYVGGNIYTDWASVPNRYKVDDPQWPDARRSTASIFRFTW
jgi:polar amino acid transport system substrate-binding protein